MQALVTGGGGFLGRAIVERLLARGDRVRVLARGDYPDLRAIGAELVRADLRDRAAVIDACRGCEAIFHVAALAGIWGDERTFRAINYDGTLNVLAGAKTHGTAKLIYTSSPSVVFDGQDMAGVNESVPYPLHYLAAYPRTKAMAERAVLDSSSASLTTVALRPHLIWGPRDNHLVPRILARARSLRRIGDADPLIDTTYVDNAADAHLLAADRLAPGAACAGHAYFISNGEPRPLWEIVNRILAAGGLPPVTRRVPTWIATLAAGALEATHRALRIDREPRLTRFLVGELTKAHWFDLTAAQRDLGYTPRISLDEGFERLRDWLAHGNRNNRPDGG